jgi:ribosomal protein S18 acetylase RimI-like enzyme
MFDAFSEDDADLEPLSELLQVIVPKLAACSIREYHPNDLEACLDIHESNEPDFVRPQDRQAFREFLELGTTYQLVLIHDGDVIACGGLDLLGDEGSAYLLHGMVHEEYQQRGFGTALLAARLALLEVEDRPLDVWLRASAEAAGFYRRFGFQAVLDEDAESHASMPDQILLCRSLDAQDILDIRDALEERNLRIKLRDEG